MRRTRCQFRIRTLMTVVAVGASVCAAAGGAFDLSALMRARLASCESYLRIERIPHVHPWEWGRTCNYRNPEEKRLCRLGNCYYAEISYESLFAIATIALAVPIVSRYRPKSPERRRLS